MRVIDEEELYSQLYKGIIDGGILLPKDVKKKIVKSKEVSSGVSEVVLSNIIKNLECAETDNIPMCQDTGMVLFFVEIGREIHLNGINLENVINKAIENAYRDGFFRKSVVLDPLNGRKNSKNNLPAVVYYDFIDGDKLKISGVLKGFGSENCSRTYMLKPTAGREAVINAVVDTIEKAGGAPCPPTVLGVGIGGTMDYAAKLSKKALLRELDDTNKDPYYRDLEDEILDRLNRLDIGPGGLGGEVTTLGVKIEHFPTHIAGLPVAVSVNCWADRKVKVVV